MKEQSARGKIPPVEDRLRPHELRWTSGDVTTVPLDMAKFDRMILNVGGCGRLRFFGEGTFEKMLPRKLTTICTPDTYREAIVPGAEAFPK